MAPFDTSHTASIRLPLYGHILYHLEIEREIGLKSQFFHTPVVPRNNPLGKMFVNILEPFSSQPSQTVRLQYGEKCCGKVQPSECGAQTLHTDDRRNCDANYSRA